MLFRSEGNRYAVPWRFAGRHVSVAATEAHVEIRDGRDLLAVHPRGLVRGLTLPLAGQYRGAPLGAATAPGRALGRQIVGPDVQVRSLAAYEALGGGA